MYAHPWPQLALALSTHVTLYLLGRIWSIDEVANRSQIKLSAVDLPFIKFVQDGLQQLYTRSGAAVDLPFIKFVQDCPQQL